MLDEDDGAYVEPPSAWETYSADEAERMWQQQREHEEEAEREHADEMAALDDDDPADLRERDLAPRAPVPSPVRSSPLKFTPAQARVADAWVGVPHSSVHAGYLKRESEWAGVEVSPDRLHDDMSREPATLWLKRHDPQLTPEGVAGEVAKALEVADLTPEDVADAFKGGRPTAGRKALRGRLREALSPIYADDRSRVLMSKALACSRQALHKLMT